MEQPPEHSIQVVFDSLVLSLGKDKTKESKSNKVIFSWK